MNKPQVLNILQIGTQMLLVALLVLLAVWLILETANIWIPIEYGLPAFPADRFGFSTEDRIYWSQVDVKYLLGDHKITYFDQFTLPDGSPMHNPRELRHMQDVFKLIQIIRGVLGWGGLAAIGSLIVLGRFGMLNMVGETLKKTARWTAILMVIIGAGLVAAFGFFFVGFHRIFFEGDTWIFPLSDTFIRLYPEKFWRDTFTIVVAVTLLEAALLYLFGRFILPHISNESSE